MKTNEILKNISECGGFNNWNHWTKKECAEWVKANYNCSHYVASNIAKYIVNGWY